MSTGDDDVCAFGQRVVREAFVEAEVGGPGGVYYEWDAVVVGDLAEAGDVAHGSHVAWFTDKHCLGVGVLFYSFLEG